MSFTPILLPYNIEPLVGPIGADLFNYPGSFTAHLEKCDRLFIWPKGYQGPCYQYESLHQYNTEHSKPFRVAHFNPKTHMMVNTLLNDGERAEAERGIFPFIPLPYLINKEYSAKRRVTILTYPNSYIAHIHDDGDVFIWATGYEGLCREYESVHHCNVEPDKPVLLARINPDSYSVYHWHGDELVGKVSGMELKEEEEEEEEEKEQTEEDIIRQQNEIRAQISHQVRQAYKEMYSCREEEE